jgi:tripartite-type tricarboxylate transporter receptor subunit TctC
MRKAIIMSMLGLMSAMTSVGTAHASPQDTIKLISTYPPGGPGDQVVRAVQTRLKKELDKNVVIDYKTGAGMACNEVVNTQPTETVLMISHPAFITNSIINPGSSCDYTKVVPVSLLGNWPMMLTVSNDFGKTDIKKWPTGVTYASSGIGTGGHLLGELLSVTAKLEMTHVPYKGVPQYLPDLISGRVNAAWTPASAIVPYIQENKMFAVAVTGKRRNKVAPDVPTLEELGFKGIESPTWMHIFSNTGNTEDFLKAQAVIKKALADKEFVAEMRDIGLDTVDAKDAVPPKDYVTSEHKRFDKLINKIKTMN